MHQKERLFSLNYRNSKLDYEFIDYFLKYQNRPEALFKNVMFFLTPLSLKLR